MTDQAPPERVWLADGGDFTEVWGEEIAGSPDAFEYLSRPHHDALMAEKEAEIARLRGLVESAYCEGVIDVGCRGAQIANASEMFQTADTKVWLDDPESHAEAMTTP